jgi:large subunit ribosomal protein L10
MKPEKTTIVRSLKEEINNSPFLILVDYGGMNVIHFAELRKRLGEVGASLSVVKNSFIKLALQESGASEEVMVSFEAAFKGQTAFVTGEQDICAAAKILKNFGSEFERPTLRVGLLDNEPLSTDQILQLAALPSKEALQSKLLGLLTTPASQLVRTFAEPGASLARLLAAKAKQEEA